MIYHIDHDDELTEFIPYLEDDYNVIKDKLSSLIKGDFKLDIVLRQTINPNDVYTSSRDLFLELGFITTINRSMLNGTIDNYILVKNFGEDAVNLSLKAKHGLGFRLPGSSGLRGLVDSEYRDYIIHSSILYKDVLQIFIYTRLRIDHIDKEARDVLGDYHRTCVCNEIYSLAEYKPQFMCLPVYTAVSFYSNIHSALTSPFARSCTFSYPKGQRSKNMTDYNRYDISNISVIMDDLVGYLGDYEVKKVLGSQYSNYIYELKYKSIEYSLMECMSDTYNKSFKVVEDINLVNKVMQPQSTESIVDHLLCIRQKPLAEILSEYSSFEIYFLYKYTGDIRLTEFIQWDRLTETEGKYVNSRIKSLDRKIELVKYASGTCFCERCSYTNVAAVVVSGGGNIHKYRVCCFNCLKEFIKSTENSLQSF